MIRTIVSYSKIALLLMGSAILFFSCAKEQEQEEDTNEMLMTEYCENLTVLVSENGCRSYHFTTALLEGYSLAKAPYREFRKGIKIITYKDDSLSVVNTTLTANYAINYGKTGLWEAKGNVVVVKSDGKTLYTQQLFWNPVTKKIYSNVDTRIVQKNGADDFVGTGFESDENFTTYSAREPDGRMEVSLPAAAYSPAVETPPASVAKPATPSPIAQPRPQVKPKENLQRSSNQVLQKVSPAATDKVESKNTK
ncbi:MAG: LPS export ABC transporter periplasmic protein LptC [Alistipes sp.]